MVSFPPPDQHSATRIGPPGPIVSPVGKSKFKGGHTTSVLQDTSQKAHSGLTSQGSMGAYEELKHLGSDRDRGGGGETPSLSPHWDSDLDRPHPYLQ